MNIDWNQFEEGFKSLQKESNFLGNILGGLIGGQRGPMLPPAPVGGIGPAPTLPKININLGEQKSILSPNSGEVHSINNPVPGSQKQAFVDPTLIKNMITAGAINTTAKKLVAPTPQKEEENRVILESKYPEVKKLLADPQTKTYLESLLTEDIAHEH